MKLWWLWRKRERGLEKEIQHHLQMAAQERGERGASLRDAAAGARREFGNVELVKEVTRDTWGWRWLDDLIKDVRYGLRTFRQNPGFAMVAALAIALGIGVNVGIFSVLNGAALRLLPIPRAGQVVTVNQLFPRGTHRDTHGETSMFSYPEYLDYRDHNHVFSGLLAYEPYVEATLAGGTMQQLLGTEASCNYFDVLNVHPARGRGFVDSDCAVPDGSAVAVISDELWRYTFGSDPSLIGKRITLNRTAYTVVGIAGPGFTGTEPIPSAFWIPVTMQREMEPGREYLSDDAVSWLQILGRVRPGTSLDEVRADLSVIAGRIDGKYPGRTTTLAIRTATLLGKPEEREEILPVAAVILAACGLVLLVACANVANLLLARATVRRKEIALRLSIGASRWRLMRQLLTESMLLSLLGGGLGSLLALWSSESFTKFVASHLPGDASTIAVNAAPDGRVLLFALASTLVTGIGFGWIPALQSSRLDLNTALKEDGAQSGAGKKSGRLLRSALVGTQVAVCMVLLVAAGLLLRGLYYAQTVDPGFQMKDVAVIFLNLRVESYGETRAANFVRQLKERASGMPGVVEVAQAECAPLSHDFSADEFSIPGRTGKVGVEYNHVSPEYFWLVGIPIVRGRGFLRGEGRSSSGVILTESTAAKLWPSEDPLNKTMREDTGREYTVIGIAKDAQVSHLGDPAATYLYFPSDTQDDLRTYVLVRFAGNFHPLAASLREAVRALDPDAPAKITQLEDYLAVWQKPSQIVAALSGTLGGLALLLASIGVYGTVSYSVNRSLREIGIRMALGADGSDVMCHVLRQAMRPVVIGGVIGIAGCAAVSWIFSSMLFGLSPHDPVAFVSAPCFLVIVALFASYVPARRAVRVDPLVALRYE